MSARRTRRDPGPTTPRQFRLRQDTLDDLDAIRDALGLDSRADAVRYAARQVADGLRKKSGKKSD